MFTKKIVYKKEKRHQLQHNKKTQLNMTPRQIHIHETTTTFGIVGRVGDLSLFDD